MSPKSPFEINWPLDGAIKKFRGFEAILFVVIELMSMYMQIYLYFRLIYFYILPKLYVLIKSCPETPKFLNFPSNYIFLTFSRSSSRATFLFKPFFSSSLIAQTNKVAGSLGRFLCIIYYWHFLVLLDACHFILRHCFILVNCLTKPHSFYPLKYT